MQIAGIERLVSSALIALVALTVACTQQSAPAAQEASAYIEGITGSGVLDEQKLEEIRAAGYAAVIDLQTPEETRGTADERAAVESRGMSYIALPIAGGGDITYANASELDRLLAGFDKPVFVHCASGNRVGALLALRAKLNGADDETALEAGKETGLTRLEPVVRERLGER